MKNPLIKVTQIGCRLVRILTVPEVEDTLPLRLIIFPMTMIEISILKPERPNPPFLAISIVALVRAISSITIIGVDI